MAFYDLNKEERKNVVEAINSDILSGLNSTSLTKLLQYFSDPDTYIRKSAYLAIGKLYLANPKLHKKIRETLSNLFHSDDEKVRQTTINAAGEIGIKDFKVIEHLLEAGLSDQHHSVRNAVIGSIKKMGQKNPVPVLRFAERFLHHENKEIRRQICHGIELRGRTHPEDILPLLQQLQNDHTARVRNTLVHVLGQIAYKKGCLETVVKHLKSWTNKELVQQALEEIIDVHHRYKDFSYRTKQEAKDYIALSF